MQGVFIVHHMKRSGGHAVINWLLDNAPGAAFVNDDIPIQLDVRGNVSVPDVLPSRADWLVRKLQHGQLTADARQAPAFLVSLEDHELGVRPFRHDDARHIVVVRHPSSLFASRIRKAPNTRLLAYDYANPQLRARAVRVWQDHARCALSGAYQEQPLTAIFYDAWLTGEGYRARLAQQLDFAVPRPPSGRMAREGRGSSFGQAEVNPGDLLRRADFLTEDEKAILAVIMSDPVTAGLADQIAEEVARLNAIGPADERRA